MKLNRILGLVLTLASANAFATSDALPHAVNLGGTGASTGSQAITNLGGVHLAGDTMTGALFVPNLNDSGVAPNFALVTDGSSNLIASSTTAIELGYVHGVTSSIQTQINNLASAGSAMGPAGAVQFGDGAGHFRGSGSFIYNGSQVVMDLVDNYGGLQVEGRSGGEASFSLAPDNVSPGSSGQWIFYTNGSQLANQADFAMFDSAIGAPSIILQAATGFMGVLNNNPAQAVDVTGSVKASVSVITPVVTSSAGTTPIDVANAHLNAANGSRSIDWNSRLLNDGVTGTELSYDSNGVGLPQVGPSAVLVTGTAVGSYIAASVTTPTELAFVHGVTALIQTQLNGKAASFTPGSISSAQTGIVTIGNGSNSTVGPNVTVTVATASASQTGLLTSAAYNQFAANLPPQTIVGITSNVAASANTFYLCDATQGGVTVSLPTSASVDPTGHGGAGYLGDIDVKKMDSSVNTCVLAANGADTNGIDGVSTQVLIDRWQEFTVKASSANSEWAIH